MNIPSIVGYTSSAKCIYMCNISDSENLSKVTKGFSHEDHFDAIAVFSFLQLIFWRKYGDVSQDFQDATDMLTSHGLLINGKFRIQHAKRLGIVTAFDLANYGRNHCVPYLQELLAT